MSGFIFSLDFRTEICRRSVQDNCVSFCRHYYGSGFHLPTMVRITEITHVKFKRHVGVTSPAQHISYIYYHPFPQEIALAERKGTGEPIFKFQSSDSL